MIFEATPLAAAYVAEPAVNQDERGFFYRYFCKEEFKAIAHDGEWVQMNHSFTRNKGTLRGMHFQWPPHTEIKLVRCISGRIWDVIVDLRKNSPTFLNWFSVELSGENRKMIYIPEGFAHGFQTLTDNCELIYHHSNYYAKESEGGIRFDDPILAIQWPLAVTMVSGRDMQHPLLDSSFTGI